MKLRKTNSIADTYRSGDDRSITPPPTLKISLWHVRSVLTVSDTTVIKSQNPNKRSSEISSLKCVLLENVGRLAAAVNGNIAMNHIMDASEKTRSAESLTWERARTRAARIDEVVLRMYYANTRGANNDTPTRRRRTIAFRTCRFQTTYFLSVSGDRL